MTTITKPNFLGKKAGVSGSRYFGNVNAKSDDDFFAEDSPELRACLLSQGFRSIFHNKRGGAHQTAVYRRAGRVQQDVVLYNDFELKRLHQRILSTTPLKAVMRVAPKNVRSMLWRMVQKI